MSSPGPRAARRTGPASARRPWGAPPAPAAGRGPPPTGPERRRQAPGPRLARPTAVLDEAHLGDIEGALGRVKVDAAEARGFRRKLITFLAIVGPGLIVMVGDNDAGGYPPTPRLGRTTGTPCCGH